MSAEERHQLFSIWERGPVCESLRDPCKEGALEAAGSVGQLMIRGSTMAAPHVGLGSGCLGLNAGFSPTAWPWACCLTSLHLTFLSMKELGGDICQALSKPYISSNYLFSF